MEDGGVKRGEPIEEAINFILEAEPAGNVVNELEEHAIAKQPNALRATQASETSGFGQPPSL